MEVFESDAETVNVGAFFVEEGLFRSVHVTFPITAPTAAVSGPVAASTTNTAVQQPNAPVIITGTTNQNGTARRRFRRRTSTGQVKINHRITLARLKGKVLKLRLTVPPATRWWRSAT